MSFSAVVGHRFGLYSKTRSRLSTSNKAGVPMARIKTTGFSCAKHVRVVLREIGNHEVGFDQACYRPTPRLGWVEQS